MPEMNSRTPLLAVVLAAGDSRRFGSDKRFAMTASGNPLLHATLMSLSAHVDGLYVVIKPDDAMDARLPASVPGAPLVYVRAPRASQGMGSSLADAVRQLPAGSDMMIALADMPFVRTDTVARLVSHYRNSTKTAPIVFPVLVSPSNAGHQDGKPGDAAGRRGHPVIFHHSYRTELEALQGDQGANRIIAAHPAMHEALPAQDPGVLLDVDQPADLRKR